MTREQQQSTARSQQMEMMRDEVANDNMSFADRRAMMVWAAERMGQPAWRDMAVMAMFRAQS